MQWYIAPGNIPAVQRVLDHEGTEYSAIYINDSTVEYYRGSNMAINVEQTIPLKVRAAVNKNFGIIFAMPVGRREWAYVNHGQEVEVE